MRTTPSQQEMRRIFEKSIRLLDSSQSQLRDVRSVLRKTVTQLSRLNTGKLVRVNEIVASVTDCVADDIDLPELDRKLEELIAVLNMQEYSRAGSENLLQINIEHSVLEQSFLDDAQKYRNQLQELSNAHLSDDELARSVLSLFADVAGDAVRYELLSQQQFDSVKLFASNVAQAAGLDHDVDAESSEEILGQLYKDLKPYIGRGAEARPVTQDDTSTDPGVNVNHLLIEFVNNLSLHDSVKDKRKAFTAELNYPVSTADDWRQLIGKLDDLVNDSIVALEAEKQLLQNYVAKIIKQLVDIEHYVKNTRKESTRALEETSRLNDVVNSDVENINDLFTNAEDLESLQADVETYLADIRQSVKQNLRSAEERDLKSLEGYSSIIAELVDAQRESEQLKAQLNDSHNRLLRDDLTGLPNRMAFNERINVEYNRWLRSEVPLSLAIWDIDRFKQVNDVYGHDVGDRVLKIVAKIISSRIRKTDMFARYGGEEFVYLMPDTGLDAALAVNNMLREKLADAGFHYDGEKCEVTSSVGIASFAEGDTIECVMKRADIALYQSKDNGRNCCTTGEPED